MRTKITLEIIDKINKIYNDGYSMEDVAVKAHVSLKTVSRYVTNPRPKYIRSKASKNKYFPRERRVIRTCNERTHLFSKGQKLEIIESERAGSASNREIRTKGKVIFTNSHYFTLEKSKNGQDLYPISFMYKDILTNQIEAREV